MVGEPHPSPLPQDVQATFCATLVDEWIEHGVTAAVIAPGSRSTPMALELAARPEVAVHVVHDERSAAFVALGLGLGGTPAVLLCTSGTAAANFYPAVVEAGLSDVAMIVVTADRPAELRGVGAPQTIDQIELYGRHVRWFHDPGVAEDEGRDQWRSLASTVFQHAATGPVQLNLPFREPLLGAAGELPSRGSATDAASSGGVRTVDPVPADFDRPRGVILAGGRSGVDPDDVARLHLATGWPIIADPISAMRHLDGVVTTAESLLRHSRFADDHLADVIVRIGRPSTSKTLAQWAARAVRDAGALLVQVGGPGVIDPDHDVGAICSMADLLAAAPTGATGTTWREVWIDADRRADDAVVAALDALAEPTEPAVARLVADHLPANVALTVASSMPVRDLEWFGGVRAVAHSNRGANGIDGVTSTALGTALHGGAAAVLIGDLAFVHDTNALVGLADRGADLRIVVVDNDGGGIFSFLPQASELEPDRFEQLFGTPLGADVVALAAAHGLEARTVDSLDELREQLVRPGPWMVRIASTRDRNVVVHRLLHAAVADALDAAAAGQ